jgi:hypothetical protein
MAAESICPGCGVALPATRGPTHRYLEASPACWARYGEILAREYANADLFRRVHRQTVDAYAVQHPGQPSAPTIQSVAVHLLGLCARVQHGEDPDRAVRILQAASERRDLFHWLIPPAFRGTVTVREVAPAAEPAAHAERVAAWAVSAWEAWKPHHPQVEEWYSLLRP